MLLKEHLKSICDHEKMIYERNAQLAKNQQEYERVKKEVASKKEAMAEKINNRKAEVKKLSERNQYLSNLDTSSARKNLMIAAFIAISVTIAFHLIFKFWLTDGLQAVEPFDGIQVFLIMNILPAIGVTIISYWFTETILLNFAMSYAVVNGASIGYVYLYMERSNGSMEQAILAAMKFFLIIEVVIFAMFLISIINGENKDKKRAHKELINNMGKIENLKREISIYTKELNTYNIEAKKSLTLMQGDINSKKININHLKSELSSLYAMNIVHPKYQNWVAVATMYEYIDVGRCSELAGAHGAYNLYEKELIGNKIISSLNGINNSISSYGSQISSSQSYIRSQLTSCNNSLRQIEINTYGL